MISGWGAQEGGKWAGGGDEAAEKILSHFLPSLDYQQEQRHATIHTISHTQLGWSTTSSLLA